MKTRATMKSMVTRPVNPQANNAEVNKSGEGTVKGAGNELHPFVDCFCFIRPKRLGINLTGLSDYFLSLSCGGQFEWLTMEQSLTLRDSYAVNDMGKIGIIILIVLLLNLAFESSLSATCWRKRDCSWLQS